MPRSTLSTFPEVHRAQRVIVTPAKAQGCPGSKRFRVVLRGLDPRIHVLVSLQGVDGRPRRNWRGDFVPFVPEKFSPDYEGKSDVYLSCLPVGLQPTDLFRGEGRGPIAAPNQTFKRKYRLANPERLVRPSGKSSSACGYS